jgi:hypothetical protein
MSDSPYRLSREQAVELVGKTLLVGKTYLTPEGEVEEQVQYVAEVVAADERGVRIRRRDTGASESMAPDTRMFRPAPPGEYRLRSTGEVIADPDLLSTVTITRDQRPEAPSSG